MDKESLEQLAKLMQSQNDSEAIRGWRSLQSYFQEENVDLVAALSLVVDHLDKLQSAESTDTTKGSGDRGAVTVSGMPQCRVVSPEVLEIIMPGDTAGAKIQLQGEAAKEIDHISEHLKDALVAAVINKSRFKLKLVDVKSGGEEQADTLLQAEYVRDGMTPVPIWTNIRGEVAVLATTLRQAIKKSAPDLAA